MSIKNTSILILTTLIISICIVFISCGGTSGGDDYIGIMLWASADQQALWKKMAVKFEKKNGIRVKLQFNPWKGYGDKMLTTLSGGAQGIDLIKVPNMVEVSGRGIVEDLTPYLNGKTLPRPEDFIPKALDQVTYEGAIVGFPYGVDTQVLYINEDMFNRKGVKVPEGAYSFSEFKSMVKKLSEGDAEKVYGFSIDVGVGRYLPLAKSMGAKIYDKKNNSVNFNDPAFKETVVMLQDFIKKGYMPPLQGEWGGNVQNFTVGKLGMFIAGKYLVPEIKNSVKFKWNVIPLPSRTGITQCNTGEPAVYVINRNSSKEKKEKAVKFLNFLVSKEGFNVLLRSGEYTPSIKTLAESETFLKHDTGKNKLFLDNFTSSQMLFYQDHKDMTYIMEEINKEVWDFLLIERERTVEDLVTQINKNLSTHYKTP